MENTFMEDASTGAHYSLTSLLGSLIDDRASYSEIGSMELQVFEKHCKNVLQPVPKLPLELLYFKWWQYGSQERSSESRRISGSIDFQAGSEMET